MGGWHGVYVYARPAADDDGVICSGTGAYGVRTSKSIERGQRTDQESTHIVVVVVVDLR
jgi:hypothetical protein